MIPTHSIGAQCPVHQEESAMGAMPWLVAMELDPIVEASNTLRPWAPRHGMGSHQCGEGTLMHQTLGQLEKKSYILVLNSQNTHQ